MGQSISLAPCCATRDQLDLSAPARSKEGDTPSTSPSSPVQSVGAGRDFQKVLDAWEDDIECGSPLIEKEAATAAVAGELVSVPFSSPSPAEREPGQKEKRRVSFRATKATERTRSSFVKAYAQPRFPETSSSCSSALTNSIHSDKGPARFCSAFGSQDTLGVTHRQTTSEPPRRRSRDGSADHIVCRRGCCKAFRPNGVSKTDRLVSIIRRERRTQKKVLDFLAQHGFRGVNEPRHPLGRSRWFPLHAAVKHCDAEMVRMLLHMGADPSRQNGNGLTPYEFALCQTKQGKELAFEVFEVLAVLEARQRPHAVRNGITSVLPERGGQEDEP
mmetsp:Transcript_22293/g.51618  ORF Transcript_22293/g.51618 Transcript_22293/m.51618 type:complete len:331 (-) Transcript_22293:461-1453(-)